MLFNSFEFLVFLPIIFLLYWFVFKKSQWQNLLITIASYIFYGWWDWRFLILIAFTSLCSFASGLLIEAFEGKRNQQKIISASNIVINLSILGIFKYYNFFVDNLEACLLYLFNYQLDVVTLNIILPVGISFYTFQALSYSIDVYRKKIKATKDIIGFFAYISFFPQLVAGPIERATNLLPQFQKERYFNHSLAVDGFRQMLWGFFKKIVIADNCASFVNDNWDSFQQLSGISLLIMGFFFTIQIYCDFSGYSDIAIGCSRLFGFNLMRNFNFPYFSRSIPEFWRRWHISLMTWFKDYIYIPLGGSKCTQWKVIRNIVIVWFISGLWHGANWTFICWGLFHALLLIIYKLLKITTKYDHVVADGRILPNIKEIAQMSITFFLAIIGWIIFRSESISQAINYLSSMYSNDFIGDTNLIGATLLAKTSLLMIIEWFQRNKQHALQFPNIKVFNYRAVRWSIYYSILIMIFCYSGSNQTFIYFQF